MIEAAVDVKHVVFQEARERKTMNLDEFSAKLDPT